ncbi:MAG TPA: enoyl-CoA hydratase-related protein [Alphaproteobacteria bacterium]|nr:enoyl-CoA hydratase-related protein [Alphaproteobacteria bacterium]
MSHPSIRLIRDGAVATLVLDRPDKHNAMTFAMWRALPELVAEAEADTAVKVMVVRGGGDTAFSAGADIAEFENLYATAEAARAYNAAVRGGLAALETAAKPSIALVNGLCVGGGCGIALACDLRFAAEGARFGITPAKLGLVYAYPDTKRLVDTVGPARAKDLLFSGRLVGAREALGFGLIDRIAPADRLAGILEEYLAMLVGASQYSVRAAKRIIRGVNEGVPADDNALRAVFEGAFEGEDFREGYRAFLEKRPPRFTWR